MKSTTLTLIFTTMLLSTAVSAVDFPEPLHHPITCTQTMSCIEAPTRMSTQPNTLLQSNFNEAKTSQCISTFMQQGSLKAIEFCSSQLQNTTLTSRQRAKLLLMLGYAYASPKSIDDWNTDPTNSKQISAWQAANEADANYMEPYLAAVRAFMNHQSFLAAQKLLDNAEGRFPNSWEIKTLRSELYHNENVPTGALNEAIKAYRIAPSEPEVIYTLGIALFINNKYEEAIEQLMRVTQTFVPNAKTRYSVEKPDHPWGVMARIYRNMGKPDLAADAITKLMNEPDYKNTRGMLLSWRSEYYEMARMYPQALADLDESITNSPPQFQQDLSDRRTALRLKSINRKSNADEIKSVLASGKLKPILNIQVFLRNQGFNTVTINGKYDAATKMALDDCLSKSKCKEIVGQSI